MKRGSISNLKKREKYLLFLCISTAFLSLSFKYVINPFLSRWGEVERAIVHNELLLAKGKRTLAKKDFLASEYESVQKQILSTGSTEEEISSFLSEIESISGSGIRIMNIKPRSIEEMGPYELLTIELDLEAEIVPLSRFLYDIYRSPMLLELEQLDLSPVMQGVEMLKGHLIISRILSIS